MSPINKIQSSFTQLEDFSNWGKIPMSAQGGWISSHWLTKDFLLHRLLLTKTKTQLQTRGKPSTWLPRGRLVELCVLATTYIHTHTHTYTHTYIHTYVHTYTRNPAGNAYMHTHTYIHIHTCVHTYTHTLHTPHCNTLHAMHYIHTLHTYITHTRVHSYIHTCNTYMTLLLYMHKRIPSYHITSHCITLN